VVVGIVPDLVADGQTLGFDLVELLGEFRCVDPFFAGCQIAQGDLVHRQLVVAAFDIRGGGRWQSGVSQCPLERALAVVHDDAWVLRALVRRAWLIVGGGRTGTG
jgi:hypothetical protein